MDARNERWEFKIGVPVEAHDGPIGHLRQVILNPGDGRVSALVVLRGVLPPWDYVIPVEAVEEASDNIIRVNLTRAEIDMQPPLQPDRYIAPDSPVGGYTKDQALFSLQGQPKGSEQATEGYADNSAAVIQQGQRVFATDGEVGKVDRVLVDSATKRATHFTVRKGLLFHKDIMVPVEWIAEYHPDFIKVGVNKILLGALPPYLPDQELQWAVEDALWNNRILEDSMLSTSPVYVTVRDGVVTLRGHLRTLSQKKRAETLASVVHGVLRVINLITADDELEQAVKEALARDPRTRDLSIRVYSWLAHLHLDGEVPTKVDRKIAQEIAESVPGVENVVNLLDVKGVPTPWERQRLRELATGQPVFADGSAIGQVQKLLVDPETWRVTGIVVRTKASDAHGDSIVVPVEYVQRSELGSVHLSLSESEVSKLPRFNPATYTVPDKDWQPPLPYKREDVVLDMSQEMAAAGSR